MELFFLNLTKTTPTHSTHLQHLQQLNLTSLKKTNVKLTVYDILGREVEILVDKELEPGKYKLNFTATNLPSGVYFYTLRTPKFTKTNKMLLIK